MVDSFKWDVSKLDANFSLSPIEGYISAGMDVPFDVVFHPKDIRNDIRCEVWKQFLCKMKGCLLKLLNRFPVLMSRKCVRICL